MQIMADQAEYVIGVNTHRDQHAIAVLDRQGDVRHALRVRAERPGYAAALRAASAHAPGRRLWAVESSGSYGAGLVAYLQARGERVAEVDGLADRLGATAPRTTTWTPSAPAGKRSGGGWPTRGRVAPARGCARSCSPAAGRCALTARLSSSFAH